MLTDRAKLHHEDYFGIPMHCLQAYDLLKCTAGKSVVCLKGNDVVNSYSGTKSTTGLVKHE